MKSLSTKAKTLSDRRIEIPNARDKRYHIPPNTNRWSADSLDANIRKLTNFVPHFSHEDYELLPNFTEMAT